MKVKFLKSATLTACLAASLSFAQANTAPATTVAPQSGAGGCATGSALVDGQCVVTTTVAPVAVAQAQEATGSVPTEGTDPVAPTATLEEVDTVTMVVGNFERQVAEVEAALAKQLANQNKPETQPEPQPVPEPQPNPGTEIPKSEVPEVGGTNSDAKTPEGTVENPGQSNPNPNSGDNPEPKAKPLPTDGDGTNDGEEKVGDVKDGDEKTVTNDQENKNKSEPGAVEDQEKGDQQLTKEEGEGDPQGKEKSEEENEEEGDKEPPAPPSLPTASPVETTNGQQDRTGNGTAEASEVDKKQQEGSEQQDGGSGKSLDESNSHGDSQGEEETPQPPRAEALQQDPPVQPQLGSDPRVTDSEEHREENLPSDNNPKPNAETESKPSLETPEKDSSLDPEPKAGPEKLEPSHDEEGEGDGEEDEDDDGDEENEEDVTHS